MIETEQVHPARSTPLASTPTGTTPATGLLARLSEAVIEAGWLMAVALVPLVFNSYSPRAFDAPKVVLVRVIAVLMLLAWGVRLGERGRLADLRARLGEFLLVPLVIPALYVGLVVVGASLTSIAPALSLWGSYQRMQGAVTTLAFLVICLLALAGLRRPSQLDRLVSAIVLSSWPVALYGILQELGVDPIAWSGEQRVGVLSSLGHPLFLAGYLAMVMPLTAARLWQTVRAPAADRPGGWRFALGAGGLGLLLALQALTFLFTQSRAPTVGLGLAVLALVLVAAVKRGLRGLTILALLLTLLAVTWLGVVSLPNTPLPGVRDRVQSLPYIGRISRVLDTREGAASFRLVLWDATTRLLSANPARFVLGYGPETYAHTILPYFPQVEAVDDIQRLPERAHNEAFQQLATTGVFGLLGYLLLAGAALLVALQAVGVIATRRQATAYVGTLVGTLLVGGLLPWAATGRWTFSGLGVALALPVSALLYLVGCALLSRPGPTPPASPLAYGLLAALLVHLVDLSFAFAVPATQTLFWLILAATVALARPAPGALPTHAHAGAPLAQATLLAGILAALAFGFADPLRLNDPGFQWVAPALIAVTFVVGTLTILAATPPPAPGAGFLHGVWGPPVVTLNLGLVYIFTRLLVELGLPDPALLVVHCVVWTVLLVLAAGWFLAGATWAGAGRLTPVRGGVYVALALLALALVWGNVRLLQADVYLTLAGAQARQTWERGQALFQRAISLAPDQSYYHQRYAQAILQRAQTSNPNDADNVYEQGARELAQAQRLAPWSIDPLYNSAQYYLVWAQNTQNPRQKTERVDTALRACGQALAAFPANPDLYITCGLAHQLKGESDQAIQNYQHAIQLNRFPALPYLYLGNSYQQRGQTAEAIAAYENALRRNPRLVEARQGLAGVYLEQKAYGLAVEQSQKIVELLPEDFAARRDLALVLRQAGRTKDALEQAAIALNRAPAAQRAAMTQLVDELRAQP